MWKKKGIFHKIRLFLLLFFELDVFFSLVSRIRLGFIATKCSFEQFCTKLFVHVGKWGSGNVLSLRPLVFPSVCVLVLLITQKQYSTHIYNIFSCLSVSFILRTRYLVMNCDRLRCRLNVSRLLLIYVTK